MEGFDGNAKACKFGGRKQKPLPHREMERKGDFFKVLVDDFDNCLRMPPAFKLPMVKLKAMVIAVSMHHKNQLVEVLLLILFKVRHWGDYIILIEQQSRGTDPFSKG
ncbi:hypothetical protein ACLOJK_025132 [Asimina triloba]